jgi:hypothetical protein
MMMSSFTTKKLTQVRNKYLLLSNIQYGFKGNRMITHVTTMKSFKSLGMKSWNVKKTIVMLIMISFIKM